jgi:hypothetical protein
MIVCQVLTQSNSTNWYGASKISLKSLGIKESGARRTFPCEKPSQPVISGIIAKFTPLIEASTEEDRPTVDEAKEAAAREQTVLVDGFLAPTWSWRDTPELWSGKHKTTGFNGQAIANLRGDLLFVSEPVTGHNHDMTALAETETADIIAAAYSGIGDKGYQGSDFITPFKKPQGGELLDWQKEFNAQVISSSMPVYPGAFSQIRKHPPTP